MSLRVILSVIILVFSEGLVLQGPSRPLVAQLGGVLQLPCSVETPLPLDELEVEWRKTDSNKLVHLFQGGEIRPESQSSEYTEKAYFFTKGEIVKGNYSLLLRNITTDDAGRYSCNVYSNEENSEIAVEIEAIERLVLTGTDHAATAYVGQEVILSCFVDSHIPPEEVSWTKVDSDKSQILVLLFQDNETYPDSAHASYRGRTEFFNAEIPKGNFSLRLKDVRTEDKGEYMCEAHSGHLSANTTVVLEGLGMSSMHILVLVLCCAAIIVALVVSALILVDIKENQKMRRSKVLHEYSAMEDGELDLVVGETIEILERNDSGWCLGKNNDKVGLLQSNYVQEMSGFQETGKVIKSKVLHEYSAVDDDEMDLVIGETIEILEEIDSEWCQGKCNDKMGYFPLVCVQEISPLQGKVIKGQVVCEYSAMKDYELDLVVGETIEILQMDDKWSLGKHHDKVGLFPLHYVQDISALQDISQRALRMHYVLVFAPSIFMFTAFVLWGIIEGFLGEVVTCSTINLIRFILLFKTCLYEEKLPEIIKTIIKTGFVFEYMIVVSVLYFVIFFNVWSIEGESPAMAFMGIMYGSSLHMGINIFLGGGTGFMEIMDFSYLFTMSYLSRTFSDSAFISLFAGVFAVILSNWILYAMVKKKYPFLHKSSLYWLGMKIFDLIRRLIISVVVFYFFNQILENHEERAGLMTVTALLHLLALSGIFDFVKCSLAETPKTILYKYGAVGLVAVNAATLGTELILKSRKGERTVADLRVVVLPFECVFVLGWIVLWSQTYWRNKRKSIKEELDICKRYGCRNWIKNLKGEFSPPVEKTVEMTEMTSHSASGARTQEQGSLPEPPPETDIHVAEDVPEVTNTCSSEPVNKEDSTDTAAEKIVPNADTHRCTNTSTAEEMDISPVLQDKNIISNTHSHMTEDTDPLLSHREKEPAETDVQEPRRNSVTEDMESSPLLQGDMVKPIPHSESN
ncbi:uncharacterized protein LOC134095635 [Sardina pilchardus]|uniref:uncharacterized protein LOC134095635 n=1 Tax=Sardina pilchardus TaxID=27697 RepID=UPI002E111A08